MRYVSRANLVIKSGDDRFGENVVPLSEGIVLEVVGD